MEYEISNLLHQRTVGLNDFEDVYFFSRFLHMLTVACREMYPSEYDVDKFISINEINHVISGYIISTLSGGGKYPKDVLLDIISERAANGKVDNIVKYAIRNMS